MLFDRYLVVDWSANSTPKRGADSIWIAVDEPSGLSSVNLATRSAAIEWIEARLSELAHARVLLAFDVSLGCPRGTASAFGLGRPAWQAMWRHLDDVVQDDDRNVNNRFAVAADLNARLGGGPGPFWGCPPSSAGPHLTSTKPSPGPLPQHRLVEEHLIAAGHRPFTSWQLLGAGAVGGQSLLAIPRLERLMRTLPGRIEVWPFTTGPAAPDVGPGTVVVAEVWPSLWPIDDDGRVRDQIQVEATARRLAALDATGRLAELFAPALDPDECTVVVDEEGWVLGAEVGDA